MKILMSIEISVVGFYRNINIDGNFGKIKK